MRAIVFIDGSNFYHRLRFLTKDKPKLSLLDFNFIDFCNWLCGKDNLIEIRYYIGAVRRQKNNSKSDKMYADQQRLFFNLQRKQIKIVLGQLIQHPDKSYHEKGVDVKIAVEMIRLARQDKYDTAYLLSSDTDLVPAVEEVLSFNKKVKYVGASDMQSFGLTKATGDYLILRPEDIEQFLPKPSITIRKSIPDDVFVIRELHKITWLDTYPNKKAGITFEDIEGRFKDDETLEGKQKIEAKKKRYSDENQQTWVAEEEGKIVGSCRVEKGQEDNRISAIYVLPDYQGKDIGSKLMAEALKWLGSEKDIHVNVVEYNLKAINFYKKHGFTETGKKGVFDSAANLPSGKCLPEIELVKTIQK